MMQSKKIRYSWQIGTLFFSVILIIAGLVSRLAFLQIFKFGELKAAAEDQHRLYKKILPERGKIFAGSKYSSDYFPIATNKESFLFYVVPKEILNKEDFIEKVAPIISEEKRLTKEEMDMALERVSTDKPETGESISEIEAAKSSIDMPSEPEANILETDFQDAKNLLEAHLKDMNDPYEVILSDLSAEAEQKIKDLKIRGAYFSEYYKRYYPEQEFAADILGFVGFKGDYRVGRYGIEELFDSELEGRAGLLTGEKDTSGRWVALGKKELNDAENGCDIYLTIDRNVQYKAEETLKEAIKLYEADSGSVIIMDPKTGAIIAMTDWPTFNPNYYSKISNLNSFQNGAIQKIYEPGSVFKVITMSAAINEGKISPQTTYKDEGFVKIRDRIIKNVDGKANGVCTMIGVLEKSLNTGAIFAQQSIDKNTFLDYIKKFGIGEISGVELKGEIAGNINSLKELPLNDVNYATASFGQGISVTPLEMVSAVSAIANKGVLMKPHIIDKIIKNGKELNGNFEEIGKVVSADTAAKVSAMMVSVVKNGGGNAAGVAGYNIAAKTGTAQIAENGAYTSKSIHSLVGFAPLENPVFAMLVKLDNPKGIRFSSATAGPTFSKLAKFLLEYYRIPPGK